MHDPLHKLGHTRSARERDHFLLTPDTFVRSPLPGLRKASAIVHVARAAGARFAQFTVEFEAGGTLPPSPAQRFIYVLEGGLSEPHAYLSGAGQFLYIPPGGDVDLVAAGPSRAAIIEVPRVSASPMPAILSGDEAAVPAQAFLGDDAVEMRVLLPASPNFDFAVNTMTFQPGASLPMVESHVMEHGLLMLAGQGIYRLGDKWYPVAAGDFIWMAPYCLQWFGALGKTPAKYLLFKDWNRDPLDGLNLTV
jgi:(S)-ureidoglycine aminohydrolase